MHLHMNDLLSAQVPINIGNLRLYRTGHRSREDGDRLNPSPPVSGLSDLLRVPKNNTMMLLP